MDISKRQHAIMDFIRQHGAVQVDELSGSLKVTPQTIRRDLNRLYGLKLVQRVHGGAIITDDVENVGYRARQLLMSEEKDDIAARAASLLPDNSSLILNIGTTTERVAAHLVERKGMLVITNNINVAATLWPARGIEVMIAGGTIRHGDGGIVGTSTEEFIGQFLVDHAVIGCSAIDADGEFFDYDMREVRVAQAIIRRARSVVLVADSTKFERRAPIRIGDLAEVDVLVTDAGIGDEVRALCAAREVRLEVAGAAQQENPGGAGKHDDRTA